MCGYLKAVRGERLIMLVKCHADDSGNSEQKEAPDGGLFVAAGYVMSEELTLPRLERISTLRRFRPQICWHGTIGENATSQTKADQYSTSSLQTGCSIEKLGRISCANTWN